MLMIEVDFREGRYDADAPGMRAIEWPPEPARLLMALVASAADDSDLALVRWLEAAGPPHILAVPEADVRPTAEGRWVVTNTVERIGGNLTFPARTNGVRERVGVTLRNPVVVMLWPDATPDLDFVERLDALAARVPYLGRVTSRCHVRVRTEPAVPEHRVCHVPVGLGESGRPMRVGFPGYVDELVTAYGEGRRPHDLARTVRYAPELIVAEDLDAPLAGPFDDLIVYRIDGFVVDGRRLLQVTSTLRKAVLKRIGTDIPSEVSGHGADGRPHVAYLALPFVDHEHADGRLLGVALAVPRGLGEAARRRLAAALLAPGDELTELRVHRSLRLSLDYRRGGTGLFGLQNERWTGGGGARSWSTVTPLMLDRYPHRAGLDELVADSLERSGYPRPTNVIVGQSPFVPGAIPRVVASSLPSSRPRRPFVHASIRFDRPVRGPVIAGALRYLGAGLFVPDAKKSDR